MVRITILKRYVVTFTTVLGQIITPTFLAAMLSACESTDKTAIYDAGRDSSSQLRSGKEIETIISSSPIEEEVALVPTPLPTVVYEVNYDMGDDPLDKPHSVKEMEVIDNGNSYTHTFSHDDAGNTLAIRNADLEYDYENRLHKVYGNENTIEQIYNAEGVRMATINLDTGKKRRYFGNSYMEERYGDSEASIVYENVSYFVGKERTAQWNSQDEYVNTTHADHLGSTSIVVNQWGGLENRLTYNPYGSIRSSEGPGDEPMYQFGGQEKEPEEDSTLHYYGSRFYDDDLRRFLNPDTIVPDPKNPQTFNRVSYVENNPINFIDPTGHETMEWLPQVMAWISLTLLTLAGAPWYALVISGAYMNSVAALATVNAQEGDFPGMTNDQFNKLMLSNFLQSMGSAVAVKGSNALNNALVRRAQWFKIGSAYQLALDQTIDITVKAASQAAIEVGLTALNHTYDSPNYAKFALVGALNGVGKLAVGRLSRLALLDYNNASYNFGPTRWLNRLIGPSGALYNTTDIIVDPFIFAGRLWAGGADFDFSAALHEGLRQALNIPLLEKINDGDDKDPEDPDPPPDR